MQRVYRLARTYAPAPDFTDRIADICADTGQFCSHAGIATSTYIRMLRLRTASRRTAERVACFYALAHGRVGRQAAFALLFVPNPPALMEHDNGVRQHRRHASPGCT